MSGSQSKRVLGIVVVIGLVGVGLLLYRSLGSRPAVGPMVQMLQGDSFVLVWEHPHQEEASVRVWTASDDGPKEPLQEPKVQPRDGRYETRISGLKPGTDYRYEIRFLGAGEAAPAFAEGKVTTSPSLDTPFRFMAFGDSGDGRDIQYTLAKRMPEYDPALVIHTGDLVFPDGAIEDYPSKFWIPYKDLLPNAAFYPCVGNHDYNDFAGGPLYDTFVLPENGPEASLPERHYWFDYGGVRFVCIDTNDTFDHLRDRVVPWLDRVLADAGDRWKVAFYHFPVYPNGKYPPSGKMHTLILPVFDRHHLTVGFNGHNHMYERSQPMRGERIVAPEEGTIYITTAAGGNPLYKIGKPVPDYIAVQNNRMHSFTVVDVTPETMSLRQIGIDGSTIDAFTIERPQDTTADPAPTKAEVTNRR